MRKSWPGVHGIIFDLYAYKGKSKKWSRRRNKLYNRMIKLLDDEYETD